MRKTRQLRHRNIFPEIFDHVFQRGTDGLTIINPCILPAQTCLIRLQQPEHAHKLTLKQQIRQRPQAGNTGEDLFHRLPHLHILPGILTDTHTHSHCPVDKRADTLCRTAVMRVGSQHHQMKDQRLISQLAARRWVCRMEHIRRQHQDFPLPCNKSVVTTYEFSFPVYNIVDLKFTVPVHGDIPEVMRNPAFIITVRYKRRAVLPSLFFFPI